MDNTLKADFLRKEAVDYIKRWIGPGGFYKWGGDDPSGWDCSGLIIETLQSVGRISLSKDYTAHGLYLKFKNGRQVVMPYHGCLVFWFKPSGKASHVAMFVNKFQIIEAAGGGSATETVEDAIRHNAYVRIRRCDYRGMNLKIIDPFKDWNPDEKL